MANHKAIIEFRRFLLPRISWSQVSVNGVASQLRPRLGLNHQKPASPSLYHVPHTRSIHVTLSPGRLYTAYQPPASLEKTRKGPSTSPVDGQPIRHNGVYVAAFKPAKRAFSTSRSQQKAHHFDTLKFVQRLKGEGFSGEQAVAIMRVLNDVIEESIQNLTRTMVLKEGMYMVLGMGLLQKSVADLVPRRRCRTKHIYAES